MPWRNGPHARATAGDAERERLPRAIAARLVRAGRIAELPAGLPARDAANSPRIAAAPAALDRWSREVFELIEWRRFEAVVESLFAQAGFETRSQAHGADGGVDIWLYSAHHASGDAPVSIVQCKQWMRQKVGVREVRELRGVMRLVGGRGRGGRSGHGGDAAGARQAGGDRPRQAFAVGAACGCPCVRAVAPRHGRFSCRRETAS